ncbi:MAG: putative zinc-binding protein [Methanolobus sp.]|nr:putative zinc-binding protein [Methanolobus sp.]
MLKSVEGCESINCAKVIMEEAGVLIGKHILLTDMYIKKNKELDLDPEQVKEVLLKVTELL